MAALVDVSKQLLPDVPDAADVLGAVPDVLGALLVVVIAGLAVLTGVPMVVPKNRQVRASDVLEDVLHLVVDVRQIVAQTVNWLAQIPAPQLVCQIVRGNVLD